MSRSAAISVLLIAAVLVTQYAGCASRHMAGPPVTLQESDVQKHIVIALADGRRVEGRLVRWDAETIVLQRGKSNLIVNVSEVRELAVEELAGPGRTLVFIVGGAALFTALFLLWAINHIDASIS